MRLKKYKRSLKNWLLRKMLILQTNNPNLLISDVKYCTHNGITEGFSQHGQDLFCFNKIFKSVKKGVFVDVGANHPTLSNNTYYFEKNGWSGIAFEPQEQLRRLWDAERKTKCLPYVLGKENKRVNFIETAHHLFAGVEGFNKLNRSVEIRTITLMQRRLDEVLIENHINQVDYLSIDVEGCEMNVILGIDFSKIAIKCIDIENDIGKPYLGDSALYLKLI